MNPLAAFGRLRGGVMLMLGVLALAGCGQAATPAQPAKGALVPVLAASELTVGPNRIPLGVLQDGTPVNDPAMSLPIRFYFLGDEATKDVVASETTAIYRGEGLPFGLYVGYATFDRPGAWAAEIVLPQTGETPASARIRLDVLERPNVPPVGAMAVPSRNLTVQDEADLAKISSDSSPDPDFYQMTIADAIAAQKPFVVAFSTPGYCQTAVCSPNQLVLKKLKDQYKAQMNFIHIEVYPYPFGDSFKIQRRVAPMDEWNLRTEPWTFLVDATGHIQARYEGGITFAELEPALAQLAAGQPVTLPE